MLPGTSLDSRSNRQQFRLWWLVTEHVGRAEQRERGRRGEIGRGVAVTRMGWWCFSNPLVVAVGTQGPTLVGRRGR
jgi:hypothetical protein